MSDVRSGNPPSSGVAMQDAEGPASASEHLAELSAAQVELRQKLPPLRAAMKEAQRIVSRLRSEVHELDVRASMGSVPAGFDADTRSFVEFDSIELQRFGDVDQTVLGLSEGLIELAGLHKDIVAALRRVESAAVAQARSQAQIEARLLADDAGGGADDPAESQRVLVVKASGHTIALPLQCVAGVHRESAKATATAERSPDGLQATVKIGAHEYQVASAGAVLGIAALDASNGAYTPVALVLIDLNGRRLALGVDAILHEQFVKILQVGWPLNQFDWVAGAAVLGDGQTAFVPRLTVDGSASKRAGTGQRAASAVEAAAERDGQRKPAPAAPDKAPAPDVVQDSGAGAAGEAEEGSSARILVVDDSATVRKFTERLLTRHGMHVETAKDGVDAMEKLVDAAPDVILLDIEMPRMNGFQFAAVMRQKPDFMDTPIIMISSRIAPKHQQVAGSLGVRKFLGKPYQEDELLAEINKLLD